MKRTLVLSSIVVCGLAVAGLAAQQQPRGGGAGGAGAGGRGGGGRGGGLPGITAIEKIRDNLYKVQGAGSNTTVYVAENGVILVDTKLANNGEAILKQVRTVTDKPVTMLINTHVHPDHNGSNDYFKTARPTVEVVAHANTGKRARAVTPRPNPATIPDLEFDNVMRIGSGKDRVELYYFGAGHTDGDAFVVFPSVRAMCIGDLMAWNMAPLIDPAAGGSVLALPDTIDKAYKTIKGVDLVIEGHGNVNTFQGMRAYGEFMRGLVNAAKDGLARKVPTDQALMTLEKNPRFAVFVKGELLKDLEYGDTPRNRALINLNVAYQELRGEPVTTYFGPAQPIGPEKGSAPPPAPRGGGAGRGAAPGGRGAAPAGPAGPADGQPSAPAPPPNNGQ